MTLADTATRQDKATDPPPLGARIAALRKERGLTLAQLAGACGLSEATLSRVENGHSAVSAQHLFALSRYLDVDIARFFDDRSAPLTPGVRSLTRRGEGAVENMDRDDAEVLCADLSAKGMHPAINTIRARSLEQAGGLARHGGEEFLYVLDGSIELHSEWYAPTVLNTGDSLYFDGTQGHAYVAAGDGPARILVVVSRDGRPLDLRPVGDET